MGVRTMVTVTERAKEKLRELLQTETDDPSVSLRLASAPSGEFGMFADRERDDDQIVFGRLPGCAGYTAYLTPPRSRRDEEGLSLPPRWRSPPRRPALDGPCCLRPESVGSASRIWAFGATSAFTCVTAR